MLDYKGILTNITGFAKSNFSSHNRRGRKNSITSTETDTSASTSNQEEQETRGRSEEVSTRHGRQSASEDARNMTIVAREAREDGIYTEENGAGSPFFVVVSCYNIGEMNGEKNAELVKKEEDPQKKKKKTRELNIPKRNMFAPDFNLQPDEDLPGFSPIDSEYESEDEVFEQQEIKHRQYSQLMPPPLMGLNPDIPNEYDPVIGIISIQGVPIPRSRPIDIVPAREPLFPFFGVNTDLQIMLISELMYDVFKERMRTKGKEKMLTMMENMAMSLTCGQMCGRLVPVETMDEHVFYYDYETVNFLSKQELINMLMLCEPDDVENSVVASSFPSVFHRETPEQLLERNKFYQHLMDRQHIYLRRVSYMSSNTVEDLDESADSDQNQRMVLERQLKNQKINHEEMQELIRTICQDLEEAERLQGVDFIRRTTLALYDARVIIPSVN